MAIEDEKRRKQLAAIEPPQKKGWLSKRLAITLIITLLVLNLGLLYFLYSKVKASADSLSTAETPGRFSLPGINNSGNVPTTDVAGEDIATGVTRYKISVRTKYEVASGVTTVTYQTRNPASLVLGYYKTELAKNNWILQYSDNSQIIFSRNNQILTLKVSTQNGVTTFIMTI